MSSVKSPIIKEPIPACGEGETSGIIICKEDRDYQGQAETIDQFITSKKNLYQEP